MQGQPLPSSSIQSRLYVNCKAARSKNRWFLYAFILALFVVVHPVSANSADKAPPKIDKQQVIASLDNIQSVIDKDIRRLAHAKGEMKAIIQYRIKQYSMLMHEQIQQLMDTDNVDKSRLVPYVKEHVSFINRIDAYFNKEIERIKQTLGGGQDDALMAELAQIDKQRDRLYRFKWEALSWADALNMDVQQQQQDLIAQLTLRADELNSVIRYTQDKLAIALNNDTLNKNGVTGNDAPDTAKLLMLNKALNQYSTSLADLIVLLDDLKQDTTELKQTLFEISGNITQDILNLDVASNLLEEWIISGKNQLVEHGPSITFKVVVFILILLLAYFLGKMLSRLVKKAVSTSSLNFSQLLQEFFIGLSGKLIFLFGLLFALSQLGIQMGPLLAGFGIAGIIIGFALQDTLSNFASGMMILIYRPFDLGDVVRTAGVSGKVSHMSLVSTTINTFDNQRLIIPNNKIWGDIIHNISVESHRRVDMTFGIGYKDNITQAEALLKQIIDVHPKVLAEPEPTIKLHTLGESSINFIVRPWANTTDYWDVYWDITREVKLSFDRAGISIPYPQRDVHLYNEQPLTGQQAE
ncbi:mechanosensitive ion channel family protein [uncultured Shewanella sp.]|uniref:mechanosensitive ion channel family protein n=1 Tax=uncultured Shewanella sp. TaxID=173975 RepID=UPI00262B24E6|nr:mechanosensitive ion channel family protein [uncultured Shewanella sp.]